MKSLPLLVKEAHGCVLPECSTHFVEDLESDFLYDVYLWDWGVTITVPLRAEWVVNHLVAQGLEVQPNLYKVRPQDAVAYALTTYSIQPKPVRDYLQSRFGKMLNQARDLAHSYWSGL